MKLKIFLLLLFLSCSACLINAQQGFFLDSWKPKTINTPAFIDSIALTESATVSITIRGNDTITKIPSYLFGDNANTWTTSMSENKILMKYLADRKMGVLRGPGGSISDVYFWNRSHYNVPTDVPDTLMSGGSSKDWEWYGKRPDPWEAGWSMDIDSLYSIRKQAGVDGLNTVNYGYARYGTSSNPVAAAAHLAADWVRYDNGRTKFWEIGNEVGGFWEAGYKIDTSLNKDGQPEIITAKLYGEHCRVFIDSMRQAASETGTEIFIGAVSSESSSSQSTNWNVDLMQTAGDKLDFYIIHSYFTPWNQNSTATVILSCPSLANTYMNYMKTCMQLAGTTIRPVALTEYGINAIGSKQMVSQINGIFSVMVIGEAIKAGLGEASRWDLANGYNNGDDGGLFSYGDEPGVPRFSPRPAFYYMYFMQKFTGDILLNTTTKGTPDIVSYSSSFSSGQKAAMIVNRGLQEQYVRVNLANIRVGDRYYYYTLLGGADVPADATKPYSRKVVVNGIGTSLVAGGPLGYDTIKAYSSPVGKEIIIYAAPFSVNYLLVDSGSRQLIINDTIKPLLQWSNPADIPYGTKLTSNQLNASASVPGKFVYIPAAGTMLKADTSILLSTTFTPIDTIYRPVSKSVKINVTRLMPVLTWTNPADLNQGTTLGSTQLSAQASVPGSFIYQPPLGTVLDTGRSQILKVSFTPTDSIDYFSISKTVSINVSFVMSVPGLSAEALKLYPVPVTDDLVIEGFQSLIGNHKATLRIISYEGSLVYDGQLKNAENSQTLNLASLSPGIYLLQITSDKVCVLKRILKL